jgi:enoyl-CoA hydratase/carnithine racemase
LRRSGWSEGWSLTGEPFDAHTAKEAGRLHYVVPSAELDAKVDWLIGRIRRQVADRDPPQQICDACDRLDVVR